MKIFNKNIFYLFTITAILGLSSCSDDDSNNGLDDQAPVITINEPTDDEAVAVGGEVHLDVDLEDDIELASYKIEIHNNFDGHTHDRSAGVNQTIPWSLNQTQDLEPGQTTFNIHEHLEVPANAAEGAYHLGIIALDQAGNQTEAYVEIIVGEDHSGEEHGISITNILVEDGTKGGEIHAEASLTAEHGIETVSISLHGHDLTPEGDEVDWTLDENFTNYSGNSAEFHQHIDVPANATPGEYHMTITVIDTEGHSHSEGVHFHITDADNNTEAIQITDFSAPASGSLGSDIHVEADIAAENGVAHIHAHMHLENGTGEEIEYEFDYNGETSVHFHNHIDIPATATAGAYHFELEVEDTLGNTRSVSADIDIN